MSKKMPEWTLQEAQAFKMLRGGSLSLPEIAKELAKAGFPERTANALADAWRTRPGRKVGAAHRLLSEQGISLDIETSAVTGPLVVPDPLQSDHPEILRLEKQVIALKDEKSQLLNKIKAIHRDTVMGEVVWEAVQKYVRPLEGTPYVMTKRDAGKRTPAVMVLQLSDEHADKKVEASTVWGLEIYGFGEFRCRLHRLIEEAAEFATIHHPNMFFEHIVVAKLGDAGEGDIHGSGPRNYFGASVPAQLAIGDTEAQAIEWLHRTTKIPVTVIGVGGNHTRTTIKKDYKDARNNFDYGIMGVISARLRGIEGIRVLAPNSWTAFVDVYGYVFSLNHGDDVKGNYGGIPWYGFTRKNSRVQALVSQAGRRVHYFLYGHYHTPAEIPALGGVSIHNGAFPMTDPYTISNISEARDPTQNLMIVTEKRGVAYKSEIALRDVERERDFRAGKWEPAFGSRTILDDMAPEPGEVGDLDVISITGK